ncbi:MAG: hypothetical protein HY276_12830 [Ignavibacteriales bacterium]|nr:hypothetical protein [Ignavibacteriales bacterium]
MNEMRSSRVHEPLLRRLFLVGVVLFGAIGFSCNIFETRDPESPSQTNSNYIPPTEPSLVFTNMVNAFRDLNSLNYLKSFADSSTAGRSFGFEPTPQAKLRYGGVFLNWSKQTEQQYFENMKSKIASGTSASLTFDALTAQSLQSDSAQYEATYRLTVPHTVTGVSTQAKGKAQYFLIADRSRNWVIWRWVDLSTSTNDFTWSDLKGAFGQ